MAKQQEKPKVQEKKPVNKNIVTVGRLKEVRDSLKTRAQYKGEEAQGKLFRGSSNKEKLLKDVNSMNSSRSSDLDRAKKYDGMIKKATSKPKK